ncbi:class I SAM-dependent methyltransferase [Sorangium sp. So ce1099]|uniref:class I SAM-dependent methyltransferase n=1 Tax=Sorangium sp. So ce1099 TaxID=3133331 RepID=UPI003F63B820
MDRRLHCAALAAVAALLGSCSATPDTAAPASGGPREPASRAQARHAGGAGPADHASHADHAGEPGHAGPADHRAEHAGHHAEHTGHHAEHAGHHADHAGHGHGPGPLVHRFERAEEWVARFEGPERDAWQKPASVVAAMRIAPGMRVADLGAGTGYFLPHLSRAVGPAGAVVGLDIEPDMVRYMAERATRERLANVTARQVRPDDPGLEPGSVDRILVVDTWHHIPDRPAYAAKLRAALRPDGAVVVVDFTDAARHGPPKEHRIPAETVAAELRAGGLSPQIVAEDLPEQYIVVGKRAGASAPR